MDISELVKMIAKMSGMSQKDQEQLENLIEKLDDMDQIDSLDDLDLSDLENLDFDAFDIDGGFGPRPGKRSVDDFRQDPPEKPGERVQDEVDVEVSDDDEPYHGYTWVEVENRYETFVELPEDADNSEIDIKLRETAVYVSDPVDETLETDQLPTSVENLDAELTEGGRLLVKVW